MSSSGTWGERRGPGVMRCERKAHEMPLLNAGPVAQAQSHLHGNPSDASYHHTTQHCTPPHPSNPPHTMTPPHGTPWHPTPLHPTPPHQTTPHHTTPPYPEQGGYITRLPPRGSPSPHGGGLNQKWPTNGQGGYITPAVSGIPTASERGAKSEVAHKWARWLHHPCHLGDPHRFTAGGQNQKCPTTGQGGYITPAASGIPTASERGAKSEVAHKWARWLHHPCRLGDPHRLRAGGKIKSGP